MTLAAYLAQRPDKPTKVMVDCKLDHYYNFAYMLAAGTHYSLRIMESTPTITVAHAWVPKDSEAGKEIFELFKDGQGHRLKLVVALQGPDGSPTPPGQQEMAVLTFEGGFGVARNGEKQH
jgi:hypothetical protein